MEVSRRALLLGSGAFAAVGAVAMAGAAAAWEAGAVPPGMVRRTLASGRTYAIRPRSGVTPAALVFGLHGTGQSAQHCNASFWVTGSSATTGWVNHAAKHDYTLVLGDAADGTWNVGDGWPSGPQDDEQYVLDVLDDVKSKSTNVDASQVFIAGFSAGGAMAWRMAAAYGQLFAACGSVSGWASTRPTAPIDAWHVHGTGDTTVPLRGGVGINQYRFPAAASEAETAPRGSRVVLYATSGGHTTPGWIADRLWTFWTSSRLAR